MARLNKKEKKEKKKKRKAYIFMNMLVICRPLLDTDDQVSDPAALTAPVLITDTP